MRKKTPLKLLYGGKSKYVVVNGLKLFVVPVNLHPLPVDVRIFEEDTMLILTIDPVMHFSEEQPIRLMTDLLEQKARKPGEVVANGSSWYGVVHDLDAEPSCCRQWVENCYREILRRAGDCAVQKIGLPLLGSVHGNIKPFDSLALLLKCIQSAQFGQLRQIMVLTHPTRVEATRKKLLSLIH